MTLLILTSCEHKSGNLSKSGQRIGNVIKNDSTNLEKVVVLDASPSRKINSYGTLVYFYKVKRIQKGVVDYVEEVNLFKQNDTILVNPLQFK